MVAIRNLTNKKFSSKIIIGNAMQQTVDILRYRLDKKKVKIIMWMFQNRGINKNTQVFHRKISYIAIFMMKCGIFIEIQFIKRFDLMNACYISP